MSPSYDVAVIGGGPAGMMAAGRAAELGARVVVLEKNPILGRKLLVTGGGRCNILNAEFDPQRLTAKYGQKGKVLFSPLARFGVRETWDFFEGRGLPLMVEAENRAFPKSEDAKDVQQVLLRYLAAGKVEIRTGTAVDGLEETDGMITKIVLQDGSVQAKNIVLTTGGMSRPETGSTGDGFGWAEELGHAVTHPDPALVPVTLKDEWVADLAGISLQGVRLTVYQGDTKHDSRTGKMLFTHTGISGPLTLNMSKDIGALLKTGDVRLELDLFPREDLGALDRRILDVFETYKNKRLKNLAGEFTRPRVALAVLQAAQLDGDVTAHQLPRADRLKFGRTLKALPMHVEGLLGPDKAVVTGGGVSLKDIDFTTMRSKKIRNLFLAGDILDFDRPSGGYSLQICWTTGWVAGTGAAGA